MGVESGDPEAMPMLTLDIWGPTWLVESDEGSPGSYVAVAHMSGLGEVGGYLAHVPTWIFAFRFFDFLILLRLCFSGMPFHRHLPFDTIHTLLCCSFPLHGPPSLSVITVHFMIQRRNFMARMYMQSQEYTRRG